MGMLEIVEESAQAQSHLQFLSMAFKMVIFRWLPKHFKMVRLELNMKRNQFFDFHF